jgi:hypothetical protein
MSELGFIAAAVAIVAACVFVLMYAATWVDAGFEQRGCARYELVTGRATQFRQFSHWTYDCYVKTEDGFWVLKSQFRAVAQ